MKLMLNVLVLFAFGFFAIFGQMAVSVKSQLSEVKIISSNIIGGVPCTEKYRPSDPRYCREVI